MKKHVYFIIHCAHLRLSALLLILLIGFKSYSQDCDTLSCSCSEGDINPSGIMIGHSHPKGTWMFSYRYMNMMMKDNLSGTEKVSDDIVFQNYIMSPQNMNMDMHMLMVMYGVTNRFSLMLMCNYNVLSMNMNMLPGTMQMNMNGMTMSDMNATSMKTKTSGFGDTRLYAMYSLINKQKHKLILSAGLNIPTGSIEIKGKDNDMYANQRLPYMMQLGSGTFDIMPGVTYLFSKKSFLFGSQVTGTFRPGYNSVGYAYGNDVTVNAWLGYRFLPWLSISARGEAYAADRIYGRDTKLFTIIEPDAKPKNYGGKKVSAYGGLNIYLKKIANSKLSFEYGLPIYQNLNGPQLATHYMLYAGWSVSF